MCGSYRKQLQELQSSRANIDEVMKKNRELSAQLEEKEASMKSLLEESKKSQHEVLEYQQRCHEVALIFRCDA